MAFDARDGCSDGVLMGYSVSEMGVVFTHV